MDELVSAQGDGAAARLLAQAHAYNAVLAGEDPLAFGVAEREVWGYDAQLSATGHDTAFAYVVVPSIALTMPIYHGTSTEALAAGAGHFETSSLPVGGASTHAVVTAHSGMGASRSFDGLARLMVGDVFGFVVLGEVYAYRVTSIEVVWPSETSSLDIVAGQDLATLITCWPYGINDRRLLVHAERCEVTDELMGYLDGSPLEQALASTVASGRLVPLALAAVPACAGAVVGLRRRGRTHRKEVHP